MSKGVSESLLKGRRGIAIDHASASVADVIRNESGLQGLSLGTIALLAGINRQRFEGMLRGDIGISEAELVRIEEALGIELDRSKLEPIKWRM